MSDEEPLLGYADSNPLSPNSDQGLLSPYSNHHFSLHMGQENKGNDHDV